MASTARRLALGQLPSSSGAIYQATARVTITAITVHNASAADRTYGLWVVPSGDTAADDTEIVANAAILIDETKIVDGLIAHTLDTGDEIHGIASAATAVTYIISGMVHS